MRRFRDHASLEPILAAAVEYRRLLAHAVENVFVEAKQGSTPQIRPVAIGAERNQISGGALPALDAMADERHREPTTLRITA